MCITTHIIKKKKKKIVSQPSVVGFRLPPTLHSNVAADDLKDDNHADLVDGVGVQDVGGAEVRAGFTEFQSEAHVENCEDTTNECLCLLKNVLKRTSLSVRSTKKGS